MAKQDAGKSKKAYPFEVSSQSGKKSKPEKTKSAPAGNATAAQPASPTSARSQAEPIPPEVSKRMVRRVAILSGVPSVLGISVFFVNYYLLVNHVIDVPNWVTVGESLGLFGLGFVGISYGVLSASWEPAEDGSLLGLSEFRFNFGTLRKQWRDERRSAARRATSSSASDD
ncbi:MAG: PAM68 family protein [Cyanobacteria bacterium J06639_1]